MDTRQGRGIFSTILYWLFLLFNAVMLIVLVRVVYIAAEMGETAGMVAGGFSGLVLLAVWACGSIILGMLARLADRRR